MAQPNYAYAKYQRDLAKKKKKEEKKRLKDEAKAQQALENAPPEEQAEGTTDTESQPDPE